MAGMSFLESELTLMYAALLALLLAGGVAIYLMYRWYRSLKQSAPTSSDDLAEFARALQQQGELAPEEAEKIRAALDKQRSQP